MSTDPVDDVDRANPLTWNKYAYVRNSPLIHTDPDGRAVWNKVIKVYHVIENERELIRTVREKTRARAMREVKVGLDKAKKGAKRSVEVKDAATRSKVAEALSTNGRARRVEQSGGNYPRHVNPQEGPYKDVHVETSADVATSRFGLRKAILTALVPLTMATASNANATPGEIVGSALWDIATTIDPVFLTDGIAWAVDLEYATE